MPSRTSFTALAADLLQEPFDHFFFLHNLAANFGRSAGVLGALFPALLANGLEVLADDFILALHNLPAKYIPRTESNQEASPGLTMHPDCDSINSSTNELLPVYRCTKLQTAMKRGPKSF
jgi:hypothetical protein